MTITEKYLKDKAKLIVKKGQYDNEEAEYNIACEEYHNRIDNFHNKRMEKYIVAIQNKWTELCNKYNEKEDIKINFEYRSWHGYYELRIMFMDNWNKRVPWEYRADFNSDNEVVYGGNLTGMTCGSYYYDMTVDNINLWKVVVEFTEYLNCNFGWKNLLSYSEEEYKNDINGMEYPKESDFIKENYSEFHGNNFNWTMEKLDFDYILDYSIENHVPVKIGTNNYVLVTKNTAKSFKYHDVYRYDNFDTISSMEKMRRKAVYLENHVEYMGIDALFAENGLPKTIEIREKRIG